MSKLIEGRKELKRLLESGETAFVLFYAAWCPFCQRFLPVFERLARDYEESFFRILFDGNEDLFDEYSVEVYPSVILFRAGTPAVRLDGIAGVGLDEGRMIVLIESSGLRPETSKATRSRKAH